MAIVSSGSHILPGTALYALIKKNIGNATTLSTSAGYEIGQLIDFTADYITLANTAGESKHVLVKEIIAISFS